MLEEGITHISDSAFYRCTSLTGTLKLPDSLTSVGYSTFCGCKELTGTLVLPKNLTDIGEIAFADCGFTGGLTLPEGLTALSGEAFRGCKGFDGKLTLPKSLISIGAFAFRSCGFTTVELYDAVETIGTRAFNDCGNLEKVIYHGTKEQWDAITLGDGNEPLVNALLAGEWGYTVSFDPNGGKSSLKDMSIKYEANLTLPKSGVTRTGYSFTGWNTEPDGTGNDYAPGQRVSQLTQGESITLYARWTPNTYTVRFNANKGTGKMPDQKGIPYGKATELSPCAFTRKGYRFTGWNTKANGTGETVDEA